MKGDAASRPGVDDHHTEKTGPASMDPRRFRKFLPPFEPPVAHAGTSPAKIQGVYRRSHHGPRPFLNPVTKEDFRYSTHYDDQQVASLR